MYLSIDGIISSV